MDHKKHPGLKDIPGCLLVLFPRILGGRLEAQEFQNELLF
jgi:hypothetical protein